jgi:nitroimidazol reductase NimA-like FMN-containing flavoprotein (pyridoxamine 5'-phosphate oxidase superfamily)
MTRPPTDRTRVRRLPDRGVYDRQVIDRIVDEGLVCHLGFAVDGQPFVIPTIHGRVDDTVYVHGSNASRMLRSLGKGVEACLTITIVDGLVLARSAFHHSMNYRSVLVLGELRPVDDADEKLRALEAISEHVAPGRWDAVREPNEKEMAQTTVLALPLDEASAKIRTGPAGDDEADMSLDVWAGVLPLELRALEPLTDRLSRVAEPPPHVTEWKDAAHRLTRKGDG